MSYETLEKELAEAGFPRMSIEALTAVRDNKVRLTMTAHTQFMQLMKDGARLFHGTEESDDE